MQTLLLAAHGSRLQTSNAEVKRLAAKLSKHLLTQPTCQYDAVAVGFLEFASPSIEEALTTQLNQGVTQITVLPYFLSAGNHVTKDIPTVIGEVCAQWPQASITSLPHLGTGSAMVEMLSAMATRP